MSLRDNTERHLFYKDIYKHRGYAYIWLNENAYHKLIDILEKVFCQGVVRWLAKVLPNVWQKFFQRLIMVLSNV